MSSKETFTCTEDCQAPPEIIQAGKDGLLEVRTCIGWISLSMEEFHCVSNGCEYRIKNKDTK